MNKAALFEIGAPDVDTEQIVAEIRDRVEEKQASGAYRDARIARAERTNLVQIGSEEEFLHYYMQCLRDASMVDISDFTIHERRRSLAPFLVGFKKIIWKLLKFYTYRLWFQQNEVNALMVTAVETMNEQYQDRLRSLEQRVVELEAEQAIRKPDTKA
jgi:hypothetical protein